MENITCEEIERLVQANVDRESHLMTDTAAYYRKSLGFADHDEVDRSVGEYGRGDAHVNTLEGFFSVFKRGMKGEALNVDEMHTFDGSDLLRLDGKINRSDRKPSRICPPEPQPARATIEQSSSFDGDDQ